MELREQRNGKRTATYSMVCTYIAVCTTIVLHTCQGGRSKDIISLYINSLNNNIDEHRLGDYLTRSDEREVWGWDAFS